MYSAEAYRKLVARLEDQAQRSPGPYKLKLAILGMLGYGVLGLSILIAIGFTIGLFTVIALTNSWILAAKLFKFLIIPLGLAWVILRALLVRIPPPEGFHLSAIEAPALHKEVERLRKASGAPRLTGIIIDAELNAAAVSVPRLLGLLGSRHYLVLGLPLLQSLTPKQLAGVVAHEFGHFGGGHGRFAGWIYRVRESWFRLLDALAQRRALASGMYVKFFNWYAPYFNAYSFVLARSNEYEADAVAASVVGNTHAGEALIRIALCAERLVHDFWPGIERKNWQQPEPPENLYRDMACVLSEVASSDQARLSNVMLHQPDLNDTHPALYQRLAALGVEPTVPEPLDESAAEAFLGELCARLEKRFSDAWVEQVRIAWLENYSASEQGRRRIVELERQADAGGLSTEEAVEHACLVTDLQPEVDALPMLESALEKNPDHAPGQFRLGEIRLQRMDERGVENLRRAMELDSQAEESVLHRLGAHFHALGDQSALADINSELDRLYAEQSADYAERERIHRNDVFLPHDLEAEHQKQLKSALDEFGRVSRLWLVRKQLPLGNGEPHFIALINWRGIVLNEGRRLQKLVEILPLPGTFLLITSSYSGAIQRQVKKVACHPLYRW